MYSVQMDILLHVRDKAALLSITQWRNTKPVFLEESTIETNDIGGVALMWSKRGGEGGGEMKEGGVGREGW